MTKNFINKFFFSVITKNLNWEFLTKNSVTIGAGFTKEIWKLRQPLASFCCLYC